MNALSFHDVHAQRIPPVENILFFFFANILVLLLPFSYFCGVCWL